MKVSNLLINTTVFQATSAALGANTSVSLQPYSSTPLLAKSETFSGKTHTSAIGEAPIAFDPTYDNGLTYDFEDADADLQEASVAATDTEGTAADALAHAVVLGDTSHGSYKAAADDHPEKQCTHIYMETDQTAAVNNNSAYTSLNVEANVHVDDDASAFETEVLITLITLLAAGFPSRSKQSKTQAQKKRRTKKQKNTNVEKWMDPKQANILITAAIFTWIVTLYKYESPTVFKDVLIGSSVVLYICFLGAKVLSFFIKSDRPFVLAHFVLGLISQCSYIFMYAFHQDDFVYLWRSVFTGYYLFSMLLLLINPKLFFPSFYRFYTLHHSASFFIISAWLIASTDEWPQYLILAKSIWLTSDVWQYIMQIYRAIHNPDSGHFKKLQRLVFSIERVHRCLSYYHALVIGGGASSPFVIFVFATVISIDVFDTVIQINSMRKKK
ncbi:hypothetical protein CTEN210_11711 [Chaetoceros tenuissimus]|uniref:Uncharacterized protein n=1 Tax=Chaetoceros tenuissimus TaxID=426638 RepID=A0AAD3H9D7_9STRA|nr:hypothetical protein CTEN210_11711 [Chaetoceros tenuissimus]